MSESTHTIVTVRADTVVLDDGSHAVLISITGCPNGEMAEAIRDYLYEKLREFMNAQKGTAELQ